MSNLNVQLRTWTDRQERIVQVRRVTKVVKGGKKLSFRAILIIGNENSCRQQPAKKYKDYHT